MKDYYQILGVTPDSDQDEIRTRYRKLAMQYHPDRNPDLADAEERFKEIAEAYGVLTDPVKRREYDAFRAGGGRRYSANGRSGGFNYSQEDILRDLFKDPQFQHMFQSLLREFQRSGFRANRQFVSRSFFGGRGGIFLGGLFLFGRIAGPALIKTAARSLPGKTSLLKTIGGKVGAMLGTPKPGKNKAPETTPPKRYDTTYMTPLSAEDLRNGTVIQVVTPDGDGNEMLRVTIPPGSRYGQKLRLRGKGQPGPHGRGDLYLQLVEQ